MDRVARRFDRAVRFDRARRASLRAVIVVAFLLAGQLVALSHSVDHESSQNGCVVCRISKSHKHAVASLGTADAVAPQGSTEAAFAQAPDGANFVACDARWERAPPISS